MATLSPAAAIICFLDVCGKYFKTICHISAASVKVCFKPTSFSCLDFKFEFMPFFDAFSRQSYNL